MSFALRVCRRFFLLRVLVSFLGWRCWHCLSSSPFFLCCIIYTWGLFIRWILQDWCRSCMWKGIKFSRDSRMRKDDELIRFFRWREEASTIWHVGLFDSYFLNQLIFIQLILAAVEISHSRPQPSIRFSCSYYYYIHLSWDWWLWWWILAELLSSNGWHNGEWKDKWLGQTVELFIEWMTRWLKFRM